MSQSLKQTIKDFTGGLNDTPMLEQRAQNEAGVMVNIRLNEDGVLERVQGRDLIGTETITAGTVTFTGAGLNDATIVKTGATVAGRSYVFEIVTGGATSPNTFRWSKDGTNWEATLNCALTAQPITDNITIAFAALVGHTVGNKYSFTTSLGRGAFTGTGGDTATAITGLLCPLRRKPLVVLTSANNSLRIVYDGTPAIKTIAAGTYYTYDELAAALVTALGSSSPAAWTITYSASTHKFSLGAVNTGTKTIILSWKHASTTLDPTLFGFRYGVSSAANPVAITSAFAVAAEPPSRNIVATDGAWYTVDAAEAKTKIALPTGANPATSTGKVTGAWHNDRGYFSNRKKNYLIRSLRELREYPIANSIVLAQTPAITAGDSDIYSDSTASAVPLVLTDHGATPLTIFRLDLGTIAYPGLADKIRIRLSREDARAGSVKINLYHEVPSIGYRNLIGTIRSDEIFVGVASDYDLKIQEVFGVGGATDACIVGEYVASVPASTNNPDISIYGNSVAAASGNVYYLNTDGKWAQDTIAPSNALKWYGHLRVTGLTYPAVYSRVRINLENAEHFETDLGEFQPLTLAQDYRAAVTGSGYLATLAGESRGIAVSPTTNYAVMALAESGFQVVDISDLTTPVVPGTGAHGLLDTTEANGVCLIMTSATAYHETLFAIADGSAGVRSICTSTIAGVTGTYATPKVVATLATCTNARAIIPAWIGGASYLLVADGHGGLRVVSVNTSTGALALVGSINTGGFAQGIFYDPIKKYVYLCCGIAGVFVISVATLSAPSIAGRCMGKFGQHPNDMNARACFKVPGENYLYVAVKNGMKIFDTRWTSPPECNFIKTGGGGSNSILIYGNTAYLGDSRLGMIRIDIVDPRGELSMGDSVDTTGTALAVVIDNTHPTSTPLGHAYIADGASGLAIIPVEGTSADDAAYAPSYCILVLDKPLLLENQDWEWINIYRTKGLNPIGDDDAPVYYAWAQIPRCMVPTGAATTITLRLMLSDDDLEKNVEAPSILRTTSLVMELACLWKDRMWFTVAEYPGKLFLSASGQPEHQDDAFGWYQVGTLGEPITALSPLADRLLAYKGSSIHPVVEDGDGFSVVDGPPGMAGSVCSAVVSDLGPQGTTALSLGADGHLWRSDGVQSACLTRKRLTTTMASVTLPAVTSAVYLPATREMLLSVCTAGLVPTLNIVYQVDQDRFYLDTMPADVWALDRISGATPRIMGAAGLDIFWFRNSDSDLRGDILARYRGDWDFGSPQDPKFPLSILLSCYAKTTRNIRVRWYMNGSAVAAGEKIQAITATPFAHRISIGGKGEVIGLEIRDNDAGGWMRVSQIEVEHTQLKGKRR